MNEVSKIANQPISHEVPAAQLRYWQHQLLGSPSLLELPTDLPRPAAQRYKSALLPFQLTATLSASLQALSRDASATLFMTLLAAFQTLLHRYSGQDDILVGSPVADNRGFINTLVLRADVSGNPTFRELLARVREVVLGAYGHRDIAFEKLVDELHAERSLSRAPLVQVAFAFRTAVDVLGSPSFDHLVQVDSGTPRLDMTLLIEERDGLSGTFEYNAELFDEATIARMIGHFERLLTEIVADPGCNISALPLLNERERRQLLVEWNDTAREYPRDRRVHELFEAQVDRTPDALAVAFEGQQLTYRELDQRSNQLAHHLKNLGVGPDVLVGICVERSLDLVVGVLGIMKAGGAYVPLDSSSPQERLAFMVEDAAVSVLLTQERLVGTLPSHSAHLVRLDAHRSEIVKESVERPSRASRASADDLAYVIFTSGSTGRPKGVAVPHRGLANLVAWHRRAFAITAEDRATQVASASFDASSWEIWPYLAAGASVHIVSDETRASPSALLQTLVRERISVSFLPTPLAEALLALDWPADGSLRLLLTGGDRLRVRPAHGMPFRLVNNYGPTECSVVASSCDVSPNESSTRLPSIGRPIDNCFIHILDGNSSPVPVGVAGELYIGGDGLARGYVNRPELTAKKFVDNPFGAGRLYRTGDLARWLPDGNIEFVGRIDHQVKIRGFRIELGEIEAQLEQHPSVREAVVLAREDTPGDKRLVAYVVGHSKFLDTSELRVCLNGKLPEYMVPSVVVALDSLPLTPAGKIDRKALPAPAEAAYPRAEYVAPRTQTEMVLAEIWCEVLGVGRVGIHDSFFELGGHSLLAGRAVSRIRELLFVELSLRSLFDANTVAALAPEVDRVRSEGHASSPMLVSVSRDGTLPLSSVQQRLWFLNQLDPESRAYNLASAHRLRGPLDTEALRRAFEALVSRHEALRTVFPASDGIPHQEILPPSRFLLPVDDLSELAPPEREREAARRAERAALVAFDLASGPLLVAGLLRLSETEHILLLTMHHLVSDGWSMAVLWREVGAVYGAFTGGEAPSLPPLPIQYADHSAWLGRWLTGVTLDRQLAYWTRHLEGAPGDLPLPYKGPRPPVQTFRASRVELALGPALTTTLRDLANLQGATIYMVLLGALRALLARYCGQSDLCIGTNTANRNHPDVESLIGFFANTLVLRGHVHGRDRFVDLLARERDIALSAYAHQDAPFEQVVRSLGIERSSTRMPLIQVMCVDHGEVKGDGELPGLTTEPFRIDLKLEPFDLAVDTFERSGVREITVSYNNDLFSHEMIVELVASYRRLLAGIAAQPELPLSQIELLDPDDRARLFDTPARNVTWEPRGPTVVEQIERSMRETPDAPAIFWQGSATSYRELDASSARLAALLRDKGVGPDVTVPVVADRGPLLIVGLLAVWRAGGAYVPINPELPGERIAGMIEETSRGVILCDGPPAATLARYSASVVRLDEPGTWPELPATTTREVPPDALAYVIYTSGSTGRPKGVMVTRRNVDAQLRWNQSEFRRDAPCRMLQLASAMFDMSVVEMFWPLMVGGAVILPRKDGELEPAYLGQLVDQHAVTVVSFVPSLLRVLVDVCKQTPWRTVEIVISGGEALSLDLAQSSRTVFPHAELHNQYGPTETTITATDWHCQPDDSTVPIGPPVADTTVYVLDDHLTPVPPGGIGELWIGGIQLARGYLERPALTAERFIPNPFAARPGERIYRTSDLVRQRTDGVLEYVGRSDFQVKVRGFRIELGEIEATLHEHPHVRSAAVIARDDSSGKVLVAYVCMSGSAAIDDLRGFVAERLPEYMVPSAFVILDELPLTTSGKLDRKALPAPADDAHHRADYAAPRTPTEKALAGIWCAMLKIEQVGIHDDFFALGGHSLLAVELIAKIDRELDAELPLGKLFDAPTIAQIAAWLDRSRGEGLQRGAVQRLSLTEGPAGLLQPYWWTVHQDDPQMGPPLVGADVWHLRGPLEPSAVERAVAAIGVRQEILRTNYVQDGKTVRQIVRPAQPPFLPSYEYEDISGCRDDERARLLAESTDELVKRPLDLHHGPVTRVKLIRLAPNEHALVRLMHHIVVDGPSSVLFNDELAAGYRAVLEDPSVDPSEVLAALPFQFVDVAAYLTSYLDSPPGRADVEYWTRRFDDVQPLALPVDFSRKEIDEEAAAKQAETGRPYVVHFPCAFVSRAADGTLADIVTMAARRQSVPLLVYLLAGLAELLHGETGQTDIALQTSLNVRPLLGAERLIGGFNSPIFIRIDVSNRVSRRDLLLQVRDEFAQAYAHALVSPNEIVPRYVGRVNLGFAPGSEDVLHLGDTVGTTIPVPAPLVMPFDLRPGVMIEGQQLTVFFGYNTRLFRPETIERLCARYLAVLRSIAEDPDSEIVRAT